jgi:hypothetical protein
MKGNNKIILCKAEMIVAIEFYLNNVQFQESAQVNVTEITSCSNGNSFEVFINEQKKEV